MTKQSPASGAPRERAPKPSDQTNTAQPKGDDPVRDWDVVQAVSRYWACALCSGEMIVLSRFIDQIYLYTKGGTERRLTARFLVDGVLGGEQIIPPLPFGRRQYLRFLDKLKARGLMIVRQPHEGAPYAIYTLHIPQLLACCDGQPQPVTDGGVSVNDTGGVSMIDTGGVSSTDTGGVSSTDTLKPKAIEAQVNESPDRGLRREASFSFSLSASPGEKSEAENFQARADFPSSAIVGPEPLEARTLRDAGGRYAGSKPRDVEAVRTALGAAADPWRGSRPTPTPQSVAPEPALDCLGPG